MSPANFHHGPASPHDGALHGSTANSEAAKPSRSILTVTADGLFNAGPTNSSGTPATMADIAFDAAGNLYGVGSIGGPQLYSINTTSGQATAVGAGTGLTSTSGGGLAIGAGGFYGTPTSSRFGTYDSVTGAYTNIANPTKPWRVWIPLLLLPLMLVARFVPDMIQDPPANIWMVSAFGPVLVSLAILSWFVAVSRARWWERLLGVICIVVILAVVWEAEQR
jgi:hypothetical protein